MRALRVRLKDQVEGTPEVEKVKRRESFNITSGQAHGAACMDLEAPEAFLLNLEEEEVDPEAEVDQFLEVDQFQEEDQLQEEDQFQEEEQVPERPSQQYFEGIF